MCCPALGTVSIAYRRPNHSSRAKALWKDTHKLWNCNKLDTESRDRTSHFLLVAVRKRPFLLLEERIAYDHRLERYMFGARNVLCVLSLNIFIEYGKIVSAVAFGGSMVRIPRILRESSHEALPAFMISWLVFVSKKNIFKICTIPDFRCFIYPKTSKLPNLEMGQEFWEISYWQGLPKVFCLWVIGKSAFPQYGTFQNKWNRISPFWEVK